MLNFLEFLPTIDLVKAIRVCRTFKRIITHEKVFRQTLFLEPAEAIAYWLPSSQQGAANNIADLPSTIVPHHRIHVRRYFGIMGRQHHKPISTPNPLFSGAEHQTSTSAPQAAIMLTLSTRKLLDHNESKSLTAQARQWGRMFLAQPPVKDAELQFAVFVYPAGGSGGGSTNGSNVAELTFEEYLLHDGDGIRIENVIDAIYSTADSLRHHDPTRHWEFADDWVRIKIREAVDERDPFVQEVFQADRAGGFTSRSTLTPVQTGSRHSVSKASEHDIHGRDREIEWRLTREEY